MVTASDVTELLEERPDLEESIEAALEADEPWTFDEVDIDSGELGELVSKDIIQRDEIGYRLANRTAVEKGIYGDFDEEAKGRNYSIRFPTPTRKKRFEIGTLAGSIVFVAVLRLLSLPNVFVEGHVVLSSNDPYFYRYLVDQLLTNPEVTIGTLPSAISKGEPLMVVTLWLVSLAFGGTKEVAGHVLAWYPVGSAILTALTIYLIAFEVTEDKRVGIGSVLMLGIIPAHAFRTSLGFADHHAFDYIWLALIVLFITVISREANSNSSKTDTVKLVTAVSLLGIAIAGQTLSWDNSPILLVPLALYVAIEGLLIVYQNRSPIYSLFPMIAALLLGTVVSGAAHYGLSWHDTLIAAVPFFVLIGTVGVLLFAEASNRLGISHSKLAVFELGSIIVGILLFSRIYPEYWSLFVSNFSNRLLAHRRIAEVQGIFGDSLGWILLFGFTLLLAIPYLGLATYRTRDDSTWLPLSVFGWYFLILAALQGRFAGQLGIIIAPLAGLGLVHLAERIGCARVPAPFAHTVISELNLPEKSQIVTLILLFLLVGSLSWIQIPIKIHQAATPIEKSTTAFWIADYSNNHEMEYPENYVLSGWGDNRMFNYFVNGESRSYSYAQENYGIFVSSTDSEELYNRLEGRVGFIVTSPAVIGNESQLGTKLHRDQANETDEIKHFELIYSSSSGRYKVFKLLET